MSTTPQNFKDHLVLMSKVAIGSAVIMTAALGAAYMAVHLTGLDETSPALAVVAAIAAGMPIAALLGGPFLWWLDRTDGGSDV